MSKPSTKLSRWHRALMILCLFVGIGALGGGAMGLISPDGSLIQAQTIITDLQKNTPFVGQYIDSLVIPAIALLLFVCIPQTTAGILLLRRHSLQYTAGILVGAMLIVFTFVEMILLPNPLSILYMIFGVIEIIAALLAQKAAA